MPAKVKIRNISPGSFEDKKALPGTTGNPFDVILNSGMLVEQIPGLPFCLLLMFLAALSAWTNPLKAVILLAFMLLDWGLVAFLPKTHRSFGPVKPIVLILAILRSIFGFLPFWPALFLQGIGTILILAGFYYEPLQLDIHHEQLETEKLAAGTTLKLVHLGDLHIERLTARENKILAALEQIRPDLILFSGDVLNLSYVREEIAQHEANQFLSHLQAPLGVYAVTGSPPVDPAEVFAKILHGTAVRWLENGKADIKIGTDTLSIAGLTCTHLPERDFAALNQFYTPDPQRFSILLYHSPDIAPLTCQTGFDLQLSGHTHAGQVRLPFFGALFAASLYGKQLEAGRYLLQKMTLYVTRGLGMEGGIAPRVRLFCKPELIVWEIKGTCTEE